MNLPEVNLNDDNSILLFSQQVMVSTIKACAPQGIAPEDPEYMKIMLKAADGMTKVALSRMKIKSDEKVADTQAQAAGVIADMLLQQTEAIAGLGADSINRLPPPALGAAFARPDIVAGAMEIAPGTESVNSFMQRNRPVLGAPGEGSASVVTPSAA